MRVKLPLGGWLIFVLGLLGFSVISTLLLELPKIFLYWGGVTTQGVITDVRPGTCGKYVSWQPISVRFTDQTGQAHTSTFNDCDYGFPPNPPSGSSITIVYLPDDPNAIAPSGDFPTGASFGLSMTILMGLLTLILLPLWIRKRGRRKLSLQDPRELSAKPVQREKPIFSDDTY